MFYPSYIRYELRKWRRDPFTSFMVAYPLLLGLAGRYLVPSIERRIGTDVSAYYHVILAGLMLIVSRMSGALAAFSILDDRDDQILYSIKVAPLSLELFIGLKLLLVYILSFAGTIFALWFSNLVMLSPSVIVGIALLNSLGGPIITLLINCMASNKVEGFAGVKAFGALLMLPIASLFFFDKKEWLFALEPGFWPAKALSRAILHSAPFQLSYDAYYAIGLTYALLAVGGAYSVFRRRVL